MSSVSPNKDLFTLAQNSEQKYFNSLIGRSKRKSCDNVDKMTLSVSPYKEHEMKNKQKLQQSAYMVRQGYGEIVREKNSQNDCETLSSKKFGTVDDFV